MKRDYANEWELKVAEPERVIIWSSLCLIGLELLRFRGTEDAIAQNSAGDLGWALGLSITTIALLYLAIARYRKSPFPWVPQKEGLPENAGLGGGKGVPRESPQVLTDPPTWEKRYWDPPLGPETAEKTPLSLMAIEQNPETNPLTHQSIESGDRLLESLQFHISQMPVAHILFDADALFVTCNAAAERLLGYSSQEVIGQKVDLIVPPQARVQVAEVVQRLIQGDLTAHSVNENLTKSGNTIVCEWYNTPVFTPQGQFIGIISMVQDITDRWQSEAALQSVHREMTALLNSIHEVVLLFDARGCYLKILPSASPLLDYSESQLVGKTLHDIFTPELADRFLEYIQQAIQQQQSLDFEYELFVSDRLVSFSAKISPLDGERVMWVARDITDRKHIKDLLRRYAFTDPLTGLANRCSFIKSLQTAIQNRYNCPRETQLESEVPLSRVAVILLDIDRFRIVKYSLGHWVADRLLVATAQRLQSCLSPGATLARIGGDEFAILLDDITKLSDVTGIADRIQSAMRFPFSLDEQEIFSSVSIGIALDTNGEYQRSAELLRDADTALHYARQQGQGQSVSFAPDMHDGAVARLQLETDLQRAIAQTVHSCSSERLPFQVYYQPIISLGNGCLVGFEALVRWNHPTLGLVPPGEFIPLAEETGQIGAIDRWVMSEACRQLGWWQRRYPAAAHLTVSVNVSGVNFSQVGMIERIEQTLRSSGICGRYLKLEITESVILKNTGSALALLDRIKALGINLSIDDFGTGYSSLARLHELPLDTLKIDRSFVSRMRGLDESSELVQTTIALAHTLGLDAIAEGVETAQQVELLRTLDCDYAQGYFFSKPVDSEAALNLILAENQLARNG